MLYRNKKVQEENENKRFLHQELIIPNISKLASNFFHFKEKSHYYFGRDNTC